MYNEIYEVTDDLVEDYQNHLKEVQVMSEEEFKSYVIEMEKLKRSEKTIYHLLSLEKNIMKNIINLNKDLASLHDIMSSYRYDVQKN